jgi:hypothetical protein
MDQIPCSAVSTHTLHCALELSKNSWLLAIQGSGAAERLFNQRREHRKADGEAHCGPGLLGQDERFVASGYPLL